MLSIIYQISVQWSDTIIHKSGLQLLNQAESVLLLSGINQVNTSEQACCYPWVGRRS